MTNKVGRPEKKFLEKKTTRSKGYNNQVLKRYAREVKSTDIDAGWRVLSAKIDFWIKNDLELE
jgi:hypothetical protein